LRVIINDVQMDTNVQTLYDPRRSPAVVDIATGPLVFTIICKSVTIDPALLRKMFSEEFNMHLVAQPKRKKRGKR